VHRAPGIALASGSAPITKALIAINVAIYLIGASQAGGLTDPGNGIYVHGTLYRHAVLYGPWVVHGGWYRLVTVMFLHENLIHIGFNMYALWVIGTPVEQYLGRARYIGLYFVSGLAGSAGALLSAPLVPSLGASGAVFGILGAMLILEWQITGRLAGNAMTWIVINLVISFAVPGISVGAHIGGLVGGILITLGYAHWRGGRAQYGQLGIGGIFGLIVVGVGSVALAYFKVRGYA
jgi:membrane associated rhomboid family serine protease